MATTAGILEVNLNDQTRAYAQWAIMHGFREGETYRVRDAAAKTFLEGLIQDCKPCLLEGDNPVVVQVG